MLWLHPFTPSTTFSDRYEISAYCIPKRLQSEDSHSSVALVLEACQLMDGYCPHRRSVLMRVCRFKSFAMTSSVSVFVIGAIAVSMAISGEQPVFMW